MIHAGTLTSTTGTFAHTYMSLEKRRVSAVHVADTIVNTRYQSTSWSIVPKNVDQVKSIIIDFTLLHTLRHHDYIKVYIVLSCDLCFCGLV